MAMQNAVSRVIAVTACCAVAPLAWCQHSVDGSANKAEHASAQSHSEAEQDSAKSKAATEIARATLARHLKIDTAKIEVVSAFAHTWPDSSLGCGAPGSAAAQVISPGYVVSLKAPTGAYEVHSTARYAVVCGKQRAPGIIERPEVSRFGPRLRNLNDKLNAARADLAKRMGAAPKDVRIVKFSAAQWPDTSMDCKVAGEPIAARTTKGYRIVLHYRDRDYIYHTDLNRLRPCPAIEAE